MSIRAKLIIVFLGVALIPLLFVSAVTFNNYKSSLQELRFTQLENLVTFKAKRIEQYFEELKKSVMIVQNAYLIKKNLPLLTELSREPLSPEFRAAKGGIDSSWRNNQVLLGALNIMLVNPQGKVVYASNPAYPLRDFSNTLPGPGEKAFEEGKNKFYLSGVFLDRELGNKQAMLMTAPALDFEDNFIGVIAFEADLSPIYSLVKDTTGLGHTGETLLGEKVGNQIVFLNPLRHEPGAGLNKFVDIGGSFAKPMQEAAQGRTGRGQLIDYRGKEVVAAWSYIPALNWGIVAKIDTQEAFAEAQNLRNLTLIIITLLFFLVGIMALSIAKSISDPIKKLVTGTEIIGSGNLDYKVGIGLKDEIGQLSRAFDKMTSDLKTTIASRDELDKEIAARNIAEESIAKQREELQTIIDSARIWIFYKDKNNCFLRVNKAFAEVMGMPKEKLEGKCMHELYPKEQADAFWKDDLEVIASNKPKLNIIEPMQSVKGMFWVKTDKIPYRDAQGNIIGIIGFATDITALKRAGEAIRESREDLNRAQAVAHTGSWRLDVNKNELTWSDENHRMFGIPTGTPLTYETFLSCVHPDDRAQVDGKWRAALLGENYDIVHRIVVDGEIKWVREKATLEFDKQGKLLGGFGTTQDITELKKAEEALLESEKARQDLQLEAARAQVLKAERQRLYDLLETLPVYVVLLTPDYRVSFANKFFRDRFGEDHGRCCFEYMFKLDQPCENCETYKVLKTRLPHHWEWLGPDGRNYDIYDFPFKEADGSIHIMEMGIDITEGKKAQKALLEAQKEIEKAKRLSDIGTLAATVAHELRNPLAAIRMAAFNIKRKAQNPLLEKHFINIEKKVSESDQIINNLLFYSRLRAPHYESVDLHKIIEECLEIAKKRAVKNEVVIKKKYRALRRVLVDADSLQMKELFSNLLNNAYDAMHGNPGSIEIGSMHDKDGIVRIYIKDTGAGMDEEHLKRCHEPFFTTKAKGTGLGLTVSFQIAHLHSGKIEIDSKVGEGTTVTITLPIKRNG